MHKNVILQNGVKKTGFRFQRGERELKNTPPCVISPTTNFGSEGLNKYYGSERGEREYKNQSPPCVISPTTNNQT